MKNLKMLMLSAVIAFGLQACSNPTDNKDRNDAMDNRTNGGNTSMGDSLNSRQNDGEGDSTSMDAMNRARKDSSGMKHMSDTL